MPLSEATAMAPVHLEPYDPVADRIALEKLAAWCHRFSPLVGLEEAQPPEALLLDVTGVAPLFGGEAALVKEVESAFQRLRLSLRHGLADTIGTAWAFARYGDQSAEHSLEQLPCAALRLPSEMVTTLSRLGLDCIGDLLPLPRPELQARFGPFLLQRLDQALGQASELLVPVHLPPEFSAGQSFEYPVAHRDTIAAVLRQLVERLCFVLQERDAGALHLLCRFACHGTLSCEVGLFRPTADAEHLLKLFEVQLERLTFPEPVTGISITVTKHARLQQRQQKLFGHPSVHRATVEVASLIDRLAGRLGRHAVLRAILRSDPQPEKASRYEPLVGSPASKPSRSAVPPASPLDRPLCVLRDPLPLPACVPASPGPPARFPYLGRQQELFRYWGPERIETGWWRNRGIRRDYYRVETTTGARFWLFQNLRDSRWYLQGVF